jgi:hypothetical protein
VLRRIEALEGVGCVIGRSYGGKFLGAANSTGTVRIQRKVSGGLKAVTETAKGVQEIFIRTEEGAEDGIAETIRGWE